jgi:glycosyltransferase involved in cell wall biosynthesis
MITNTVNANPLVSVIIPCYNRSLELTRAIKSVLNQTYQNYEILIIDDGSEEDLKMVCDTFNDQRIKYFRNDIHTNANVARNRGLREAQGDFVAMLDSDDEYLPHHISRRVEKIKEWNCDGIFGSAILKTQTEQRTIISRPLAKNEKMVNYILGSGSATTPSHFYRRDAAIKVLWDESLLRHQDFDFTIRFSEKFKLISDYEPTVLIHWDVDTPKYIDLQSCLKFLYKNINEADPRIIVKYVLQQSVIAKRQNDNEANDEYEKILANNIRYITIDDWFTFTAPDSSLRKVSAAFEYFTHLFISLIAK